MKPDRAPMLPRDAERPDLHLACVPTNRLFIARAHFVWWDFWERRALLDRLRRAGQGRLFGVPE